MKEEATANEREEEDDDERKNSLETISAYG